MGIKVNIWERAKARRHLEHYLEGGGINGYDAVRHETVLHGDAGKLGKYNIISFLPDKVARFLTSIMITDSKGWICPPFLTTGVGLTCMLR